MPWARLPSPQSRGEWRQWVASVIVSTAIFGVAITYHDRSWIRPFLIGVTIAVGVVATVMVAFQTRRARRERAAAPPSPEEVELRELDERLEQLKQAEPELRELVARRNAGSISEEEFARRRDELLGPEQSPIDE